MKRIGILTAGGDTPALNATSHGAVTRANQLKVEVTGLIKGFNCLFNPRVPHVHLIPLYQEIPELDSTFRSHINPSTRTSTSASAVCRPRTRLPPDVQRLVTRCFSPAQGGGGLQKIVLPSLRRKASL